MASDMTTAEMVEWLRTVAVAEAENDDARVSWWLTIAARLEALDKVARAAEAFVDSYGGDGTRIVELDAALKEAGYGK